MTNRTRPAARLRLVWASAIAAVVVVGALSTPQAQTPAAVALKTTYVSLGNNANAVIVEPATPDPARSRFALLVAHPERLNTFEYFIGRELPKRGYRVMMLNYYGPEQTYEEFIAPTAAAIRQLRSLPGVERVVFAMHSTGGPELTFYQDVAENGAKACQGPERIYPCRDAKFGELPKADGMLLLDVHAGAPERTLSLDPSLDGRLPGIAHPELDMFSAANGFDAAGRSAHYSPEFTKRFLAAQGARNNRLIDEALARLKAIEAGLGDYRDDEPFVVPGSSLHVNGARLELADTRLQSKTRAAHVHLKADGTSPIEIVPSVMRPQARPQDQARLDETTANYTVRHYLSFLALRTTPDYAVTEDTVTGVQWRSSADSVPGNVQGIRAPTLIMVATCAPHMILSEIAFDGSPAADKTFVGVEGANHNFQPCRPEFGDTSVRTFAYVDGWLRKPGRF